MKKPMVSGIIYGTKSGISRMPFYDFEVLQKRLRIFFPEQEMHYHVVSTAVHGNWVTGIGIKISQETIKAEFFFAVFPLSKLYSKADHLIRYFCIVDNELKTNGWFSLADKEPSPYSLNAVFTRDMLRAHGDHDSLFF